MQNRFHHIAILVLIAALLVTGWTALAQKQENNTRTSAPVWEYKVTPTYLTPEQINKLGAEGWELAAVYDPNIDNAALYFKRLKK
jgi:hypothetical protein